MLVRPRDLADRMSGNEQPEIFTLPIDAARCKAREIIDQFPQSGIIPIVENWRQLPDGQIEFTCNTCLLRTEHVEEPARARSRRDAVIALHRDRAIKK